MGTQRSTLVCLITEGGYTCLTTECGYTCLITEGGYTCLTTEGGYTCLITEGGYTCLTTEGGYTCPTAEGGYSSFPRLTIEGLGGGGGGNLVSSIQSYESVCDVLSERMLVRYSLKRNDAQIASHNQQTEF